MTTPDRLPGVGDEVTLTCACCGKTKTVSADAQRGGMGYAEYVKKVQRGLCDECFQEQGPDAASFAGSDYDPASDDVRLTGQLLRVYEAMKDGQHRTVREIAAITGDPEPSILAQLGHLRKQRFGAYEVTKRRRGGDKSNLWEHRVGPKGSGKPKRDPRTVRAEEAEAKVAVLVAALRSVAPDHSVLRQVAS